MSSTSAVFFFPTLAVIESCFWLIDPFGVHQALNGGVPMDLLPRIVSAVVNSFPLILFYCATLRPSNYYLADIAVPLITLFTMNQWTFWWWPYLLGTFSGLTEMIAEHRVQMTELPRLLPAIGENLVPDNEHAILLALSIITMVIVVSMVASRKVLLDVQSIRWKVSCFVAVVLPLFFLLFSSDPAREVGPMLTSGCIVVILSVIAMISRTAKSQNKSR